MAWLDFSSAPHGGRYKKLPEADSQPTITPTTIIDHSIVGSASGAYWYFHDSTGIESHFILCGAPSGPADGEIWQLMNTGREADANNEANAYAISIETEDNGDPDHYPWSDAQVASLKWLHNTLVRYHPTIPRREATSCTSGGLGYHSKMGAPSCWTPSAGKSCPGKPARVDQWNSILLPAFISGEEQDLTDDQAKQLKYVYDAIKDTADGQDLDLMSKLYRLTVWGSEAKGEGRPNIEDLAAQVTATQTDVTRILELLTAPSPPPSA